MAGEDAVCRRRRALIIPALTPAANALMRLGMVRTRPWPRSRRGHVAREGSEAVACLQAVLRWREALSEHANLGLLDVAPPHIFRTFLCALSVDLLLCRTDLVFLRLT